MSRFIIEPSFWHLFPAAEIGVLVLTELDNSQAFSPAVQALLAQAHRDAQAHLHAESLSQNPVVAVWRKAYQQFKTKKGARCSIEALLRRVEKGSGIGSINPLVDIYNAASLRYGLPCGAEDIDTFAGDLRLGLTEGGDTFSALGEEENAPTLPGELCYRDDAGAVCRCLNWRDGQRTMITEKTRRAFVVMEYPNGSRRADMQAALALMAEHAQRELGARVPVHTILTAAQPEVQLA